MWLDKNATLCPCEEKRGRRRLEGNLFALMGKSESTSLPQNTFPGRKYDFRLSRYLFEMLNADEPQVANLGCLLSNGRPPNGWSLDRSHVSAKSSQPSPDLGVGTMAETDFVDFGRNLTAS
jgi:hypothetical protein